MTTTKTTKITQNPAGTPSGNVPKENPIRRFEKNADNDGFHVVKKAHLSPFVDWTETPTIEGVVTNYRTITGGKYGDQEAVDIGDYSVGLSASLVSLPEYRDQYVRIIFEGEETTKKGNSVKTFTILVKNTPPE